MKLVSRQSNLRKLRAVVKLGQIWKNKISGTTWEMYCVYDETVRLRSLPSNFAITYENLDSEYELIGFLPEDQRPLYSK